MSGDPERLLSGLNADPLERELLGSVRHVGPPEGAKDIAWKGIAAQIAVAATIGAATGSSAAAAAKAGAGTVASWAASAKVAAVVAVSGLALGGGYAAVQMAQTPPAAHVSPRSVVTPPAAPAAPQAVEEPATPDPAPVTEDAPSRRPEVPRPDLLKAESALLTEARAQLRSGDAASAQASLDRLQKEFPKGMLAQEREVLAIEVLSARGNTEGAKRRARAFVKAYPKSPHSAKLSRFLE